MMKDEQRPVKPHRSGFAAASGFRPVVIAGLTCLLIAGLLLSVTASSAREKPPEVSPPKPIALPRPQVRELSNGLRLVVVERRALPILTLRLVIRSGAESDPPDLPGVAQLTAEVLPQGTATRSAQQIAEAVDSIGANLATGSGWDESYAEMTVLSDHSGLAFELVADVIRRPAFLPAEVARKQTQTISALGILRDDPAYMADAIFNVLVFRGTSYGHPLDGTIETVRRVGAADLKAFHARYYRPADSVLAAVGDISASEAVSLATRYFGDWSTSAVREILTPPARTRDDQRRFVVIDKPDAVQTEIRVGNLATRRDSPDYYALTAANQVLGGPATNRLFKTLRSRLGLTYGASSDLILRRTTGSWVAKTSTRTRETARSLQAVLNELERLRSSPVSFDELRTAKSYSIGHMALEFETSDDVAEQTLELLVNDLPLDYWNSFPEKIGALVAPEVSGVASRYLVDDRQVIVLVGDASQFAKDLNKFGRYQVVPLQDLDLASPDLRRPAATTGR